MGGFIGDSFSLAEDLLSSSSLRLSSLSSPLAWSLLDSALLVFPVTRRLSSCFALRCCLPSPRASLVGGAITKIIFTHLVSTHVMEGAFVSPCGKAVPMLPNKLNGWSLVSDGGYLFLNRSSWGLLLSDASFKVGPQGWLPTAKASPLITGSQDLLVAHVRSGAERSFLPDGASASAVITMEMYDVG